MSWKSVICGLSALEVTRVGVLGADQKKSGVWGRDWLANSNYTQRMRGRSSGPFS